VGTVDEKFDEKAYEDAKRSAKAVYEKAKADAKVLYRKPDRDFGHKVGNAASSTAKAAGTIDGRARYWRVRRAGITHVINVRDTADKPLPGIIAFHNPTVDDGLEKGPDYREDTHREKECPYAVALL
jgi:hypothetical protein